MMDLIIGSHCKMSSPKYLLGSIEEAHSYNANSLMIYTGAPQNTRRTEVNKLKVNEMWEKFRQYNFNDLVVHAPYIINLANTVDKSKSEFGVEFLIAEINRVSAIGGKYIVLHPGSHVKAGEDVGLKSIIDNLNIVFEKTKNLNVKIALETMAGKGSELCYKFEHLKTIIKSSKYPNRLGICLDTCHIYDAGYNIVDNFELVINELENLDLLNKILVVHLNDSKNSLGSKKDRHENIGFGNIGFDALLNICYHEKLSHIPKILETPYINKVTPPYLEEISMLKSKEFNPKLITNIENKLK